MYIGGEGSTNPYKGMNEVLDALGIDSSEKVGHHNHFHIDLRTPTIRPLPNNLLADHMVLDQTDSVVNETLRAAAQGLLAQLGPQLTADQGDLTMFVMDVPPDVPPQFAPIVIAQASQAKQQTTDRTIGVCHLVTNNPEAVAAARSSMSPAIAVYGYLKNQENRLIDESAFKDTKITVLQEPEHGELVGNERGTFVYLPADPTYLGPDRATLLVEIGGYKVKVIYFFKLMKFAPTGTQADPYTKENCPENAEIWKISLNPDDPNAPIYTFEHPYQLTSPYAGLANVNLTFGTLAPGALGQTTGTTITLDPSAAGHGWFIDTTPFDNAEYLPTHDPEVWVAREGSDAAGRMDLLSVLLHEYGHVLGIDHSADHSSYMATTLTPGTRRMPSNEEFT